MRLSQIALPCGARLVTEQDDDPCRGLYGPSWLGAAGLVRCRLDNLPVTVSEARALVEAAGGRYRGGSVSVSHRYGGGMEISGIGLTAAEANAIADGTDPLTVLGVYPAARVVLSIVRLPLN